MCLQWGVYIWKLKAQQNSQINTDSIQLITLHIRAVKGHPQGDPVILDNVSKTKDGTWIQKHAYCVLRWLTMCRGYIRGVAHDTKGRTYQHFFNNYRQRLIYIYIYIYMCVCVCVCVCVRALFVGTEVIFALQVPVPDQSLYRFVS
jgi:hypothetical protein